MGNECSGQDEQSNAEFLQRVEAHRKFLEDYEKRLKDNEALLLSRLSTLNTEKEKFEEEKSQFRKQTHIVEAAPTEEEEGGEGENRKERAGRELQPAGGAVVGRKGSQTKLCDFQFIVNYHFR